MNYATLLIAIIVAIVPVSAALSAAWALYDWLVSRLPKNVQAVLIVHEAQVRNLITSVVDAVEQSMKGASNEEKKAEAVATAENIFASLPLPKSIPQPSAELINTLIEQAVAYLPPTNKPVYSEPAKSVKASNQFDPAITQADTTPLPTVSAVGAVPPPLEVVAPEPPPVLENAL